MKQILLNPPKEIQRGEYERRKVERYRIYVSREITFTFTSKDEANKFLTRLKQFYTFKVMEINKAYIRTFEAYRKAWFLFASNKTKSKSYRDHDYRCKEIVQDTFPFQLDFVMNKEKPAHMVHSKLSHCISLLQECLLLIRELYQDRKLQFDLHAIDIELEALHRISESFDNFEREKADKTINNDDINFQLAIA